MIETVKKPLAQRLKERADIRQMEDKLDDAELFAEAAIAIERQTTPHLIWSFQHDAWWGPCERGYVQNSADAGRYRFEIASRIVDDSNVAEFNSAMLPVPHRIGATRPLPITDRTQMTSGKISDDRLAEINDSCGTNVHPADVSRMAGELLALRAGPNEIASRILLGLNPTNPESWRGHIINVLKGMS